MSVARISHSMLLARWLKPRLGLEYLEKTPYAQFRTIAALSVLYFIQVSLFILLMGKSVFTPLLTIKGLILALVFIVVLVVGTFVAIQAASIAFWWVAKQFKGCGTLAQTRAAVVWSSVGSSLMGCFWLLLYASFSNQHILGKMAIVLALFSYVGGVATIVYMLISLVRALSEINKLGYLRTVYVVIAGLVILGGIVGAILRLRNI